MAKTVIWTKRAEKRFDEMVEYLLSHDASTAAANLINSVVERIAILSQSPGIGRRTKKSKTIRSFLIDEHKIIFYRIEGSKMIISDLFDQRQDPSKKPF